jgi:hypothetical protein
MWAVSPPMVSCISGYQEAWGNWILDKFCGATPPRSTVAVWRDAHTRSKALRPGSALLLRAKRTDNLRSRCGAATRGAAVVKRAFLAGALGLLIVAGCGRRRIARVVARCYWTERPAARDAVCKTGRMTTRRNNQGTAQNPQAGRRSRKEIRKVIDGKDRDGAAGVNILRVICFGPVPWYTS